MSFTEFNSSGWLLTGISGSSAPGWLVLHQGRLSFTIPGSVVFDVKWTTIERVVFPWYYFGGGMKLWIGGTQHRLSFVRPNGAEVAMARGLSAAGSPLGLLMAAGKVNDMVSGRAAGKRWRELLGT
ncbi:MAG: hypothetical protein ABJB33_00535 [Gemmatimonadota bacterium]